MASYLWVCIKIGDQIGDEKLTIKDGMLIDYIDPNDANYGEDWFPPASASKVFLWLKVPNSYENSLRNWLQPDTVNNRIRRRLLQLHSLPVNIQNKIRNKADSEKVIDLTQTNAAILKSDGTRNESAKWTTQDVIKLLKNTATLNPAAVDENAISSGSYNIGSGETYTTLAQFCADLTTLTGDLTGTFTSSTTETAQSTITGSIGSYTLKITSNSEHYGNPNSGHLISDNFQVSNDGALRITSISGGGTIEIKKLKIKFVYPSPSSVKLIQSNSSFAYTLKIHDMILDANDNTWRCIDISDNDIICQFYNIKAFGATLEAILPNVSNSSLFENIVCHSSNIGFNCANLSFTLRNVVCHDNSTNFSSVTSATGYNCATTDSGAIGFSTEVDTVNNIIDSDFLSVTSTDSDYLDINEESSLFNVGSDGTIDGNVYGINGVLRVSDKWDIGAFAVLRSGGRKNRRVGVHIKVGL